MVTNLRYADDTTLMAGTKEDLIEIMQILYLNVLKTKVLTTADIGEVTVERWENRGGGNEFHISRRIDNK